MKSRFLAFVLLLAAAFRVEAQHEGHARHASPEDRPPTATTAGDPHDGHAKPDKGAGKASPPPSSPAPLPPPTPEELAAAFPDLHGMRMQDHMDDDPVLATLLVDRIEWQDASDGTGLAWELQGWVGDLENRLWLRSEGERRDGRIGHGDVELLWGRPNGPWWDVLAGARHDFGEGPSRDWLTLGVQGLAPYKFEVAATAYLGTGGRLAGRVEAEYDLLLTNRLVLQPRIEANAYSKDDAERGIGKGISNAELGLRLRYEVHRQFAPYIGHGWSRSFGRTSDMARAAGHEPTERMWVAGLRFWF